jgi:hypothetical protein
MSCLLLCNTLLDGVEKVFKNVAGCYICRFVGFCEQGTLLKNSDGLQLQHEDEVGCKLRNARRRLTINLGSVDM